MLRRCPPSSFVFCALLLPSCAEEPEGSAETEPALSASSATPSTLSPTTTSSGSTDAPPIETASIEPSGSAPPGASAPTTPRPNLPAATGGAPGNAEPTPAEGGATPATGGVPTAPLAGAGGTSAGGAGPFDGGVKPAVGGSDAGVPLDPIAEDVFVAEVFSGHPVYFALATFEDRQFVAYYDAEQRMTVASRTLGESEFVTQVLPTSVGWDSHNSIALAVDETGHVHVSGNMHNVPLIYFRTTTELDVTTLARVDQMVGTNEDSVTYPEFFQGPEGNLIFIYRDGGSGSGNHIFDSYDASTREWSRLLDTPLTDGQGQRNAYPVGPIRGADGSFHLVWVWRDSPDAATNHDLSYARTANLVDWESGAGDALTLPITLSSGDIVDAVPAGGGMINNNTKVGFDAEGRPIVVYHKYDAGGSTQLYNARLENGEWVVHQTSNWDYRWEFGGQGTLVFAIEVDPVVAQPDGTLTQRFYHAEYGGWGAFRLDPDTLEAVETVDPPLPYPRELDVPVSTVQDMGVRWQKDWGAEADAEVQYMLRWETLPSNRDMPRNPVPPPTDLRLYGFRR